MTSHETNTNDMIEVAISQARDDLDRLARNLQNKAEEIATITTKYAAADMGLGDTYWVGQVAAMLERAIELRAEIAAKRELFTKLSYLKAGL